MSPDRRSDWISPSGSQRLDPTAAADEILASKDLVIETPDDATMLQVNPNVVNYMVFEEGEIERDRERKVALGL